VQELAFGDQLNMERYPISSISSMAPRKELLPKSIVTIILAFTDNNLLVRTGASAPRWRLEHDFFVA